MPSSKKVLIIDDDADYRRLLGEVLQMDGWEVFEADEGESGMDLVRAKRPEIVLCDLLMPRANGFFVCRKIRGDIALRHTKIIVTSGRDYDSDRQAAREAGADSYLTKPVRPDELVAAMTKLTADMKSPVQPFAAGNTTQLSPARAKFWGVRGSIPTPGPATMRYGGNTSCVEVRAGGEIIILDAGTGLRSLGRELLEEFKGQPFNLTLLLSHTHWDHIQGLPFFPPIYSPNCQLRILGFEGARKGLVHVLTGQMESPYFPVPFEELPGNVQIEELKDMEFSVGSVRIKAWFANHPGICVGYRIFTDEGSVAFFPDNEPHARLHHGRTALAGSALNYAEAQEQKTIEFLRGTDVLILDAQYDLQEYERHVGWGHGCVDSAVSLALNADVRQLILFHHDPDHDDDKVASMLAQARELVAKQNKPLLVEAATEGTAIELRQLAKLKPK